MHCIELITWQALLSVKQVPLFVPFTLRRDGYRVCEELAQSSDGKESACDVGDTGSIPGLGRSPGGGHGNLLLLRLENPMDRGGWLATVHGVAKTRTRLSE